MNFIPPGDKNPLKNLEGQTRVLEVLIRELCTLRADTVALQAALLAVGAQQGIDPGKLTRERIDIRNASFEKICSRVIAELRGGDPAEDRIG